MTNPDRQRLLKLSIEIGRGGNASYIYVGRRVFQFYASEGPAGRRQFRLTTWMTW